MWWTLQLTFVLAVFQFGISDKTPILHYYNRGIPEGVVLDYSKYALLKPMLETKFIIHGINDSVQNEWALEMKREYLTKAEYNVILLDRSQLSSNEENFSYLTIDEVEACAEKVEKILGPLVFQGFLVLSTLHIIVYSLGAQIGSQIAVKLFAATGIKVARITCLDAAGPGFVISDVISKMDALFVDAIHTSTMYRSSEPFASVDFFVNGGTVQPGCRSDKSASCSHERSILLWIESITSNSFIATECHSNEAYNDGECIHNPSAIMGDDTSVQVTGTFYVNTNSKAPFAMGATNITSNLSSN